MTWTFGCSSSTESHGTQLAPPPAYDQSPIVFGSGDPPGTFASVLSTARSWQINDNYYFWKISLSPSRKRVLQVTDGSDGVPRSQVDVYEVKENGALLGRFPTPGEFLGWRGDDVLIFVRATDGLTRIRVNGSKEEKLDFPDWVKPNPNGPHSSALSPDGSAAAFALSVEDHPFAPNGFGLIVVNTSSGAVSNTWDIPDAYSPGSVIWARDERIVYYPVVNPAVLIGDTEADSLSGPVALPFQPCNATPWVSPTTLHFTELVQSGDSTHCVNSWLLETDGRDPRKRDAEAPVAVSPDDKKILLRADPGTLFVAAPDGSNPTPISGIPKAHKPVW